MQDAIAKLKERIKNGDVPENIDEEILNNIDLDNINIPSVGTDPAIEKQIKKIFNRFENLSKYYVETKDHQAILESVEELKADMVKREEEKHKE